MIPRSTIVSIVALALALSSLRAAQPPSPPIATILCYHIVQSPNDTKFSITRETFDMQMNYLASAGFNVVSMADVSDFLMGRRKTPLPKNAVVVTIDDGWKCTYTEIWPVMRKYRFPFTVFVYPKFIGQSGYALKWNEIREMSDAGVDIQSHSFSHPFLTQRRHRALGDGQYSDWLATELRMSKKVIEEKTGKRVRYLAYPYGDFDSRVMRTAAESGYEAAVIAEFGHIRATDDRYKLRRVVIDTSQSFADFRRLLGSGSMKLSMTYPPAGSLFNRTQPAIAARIENFKDLDPASVGMSVLSVGAAPFTYNPKDGTIATVVRGPFRTNRQQVLVWGVDAKTGKRLEATWSFYANQLPPKPLPPPVTIVTPPAPTPVEPPTTTDTTGTTGTSDVVPEPSSTATATETAPPPPPRNDSVRHAPQDRRN